MAFRHRLLSTIVLSSLSGCLWFRFVHTSFVTASAAAFLCFVAHILSLLVFNIFIYPRYSPLKHLPTAPQRPLRQRLFKEPNPFQFARWINEVPNEGLIRYFGFLNAERVLIANPEAARQVMQVHTYDFIKPHEVRLHLSRFTGKGTAWQEGEGHKFHRPVMDVAFQHKNMKAIHPLLWNKAVEMTELISQNVYDEQDRQPVDLLEKSPNGAQIEVKPYIDHVVFDNIGLALHGKDMKALTNPELNYDKYSGFLDAVEPSKSHRNRMIAAFALPGWLVNLLPLDNNRLAAPAMAAFRKLGKELIASKSVEKPEKSATHEILRTVLEQGRFTEDEVLSEFLTVQTAGMHPPASAILSTIWLLSQSKYQHVQQKLREEIQKARPDGTSDRVFEKMPYLEAVLNEVLRLHSVFTHTGRQPIREVTICGTQLPLGVTLSLSPYALHRSVAVWGPDAAEFRPERWLNGEAAVKNSNNYLAFGANPRVCLGERYARAELRCLISALFGRLDFRFPDGGELPRVTHQVTLAFKDAVKPVVRIVE